MQMDEVSDKEQFKKMRKRMYSRQEYQRRKAAKATLVSQPVDDITFALPSGTAAVSDRALLNQLLVEMAEVKREIARLKDENLLLKAAVGGVHGTAALRSEKPLNATEWLQKHVTPEETYEEWRARFAASVCYKEAKAALSGQQLDTILERKLEGYEPEKVLPLIDAKALGRGGDPHMFGDDRQWRAISEKEFKEKVRDALQRAFESWLFKWRMDNMEAIMDDEGWLQESQKFTFAFMVRDHENASLFRRIEAVVRKWLIDRSRLQLKKKVAAKAVADVAEAAIDFQTATADLEIAADNAERELEAETAEAAAQGISN